MILNGFISYTTSHIIVSNMKDRERDVIESIKRILGKKWEKVY